MYPFYRIFHPEVFQGRHKRRNYFEGWYYKLIDEKRKNALAIIPGVSFGKDGKHAHAFIQVLNSENQVNYIRYPISEFEFDQKEFRIRIGDNYFSKDSLSLKIHRKEIEIEGELLFNDIISLPKSLLRPGIMGIFSYIPYMECYHGLINMHHRIIGKLSILGDCIDFTKGYGYIEKDWGKSFPESWIWIQSNHFHGDDVTLMFSAAMIPWLTTSFPGFISFLRLGQEIYVFATYTGAHLKKLEYEGNQVNILLYDRRHILSLKAKHSTGGSLKAPKNGQMNRDIIESINGNVNVTLKDHHGNILYQGKGTNTGLEIEKQIFIEFKK
ncbi:MAG: hypothetical protein K0S47_2914 [Herbinix sp.]|jgi:hypothetical protein|nr:hypothetical protein [Herbinix sp.]